MLTVTNEPLADQNWLGVERWILRTLSTHEQKQFMVAFRRLTSKFIHPDLTQDPDKHHVRAYFLKQLNEAVEAFRLNPQLPEHKVDPTIAYKIQVRQLQAKVQQLQAQLAKLRQS